VQLRFPDEPEIQAFAGSFLPNHHGVIDISTNTSIGPAAPEDFATYLMVTPDAVSALDVFIDSFLYLIHDLIPILDT